MTACDIGNNAENIYIYQKKTIPQIDNKVKLVDLLEFYLQGILVE